MQGCEHPLSMTWLCEKGRLPQTAKLREGSRQPNTEHTDPGMHRTVGSSLYITLKQPRNKVKGWSTRQDYGNEKWRRGSAYGRECSPLLSDSPVIVCMFVP